MARKKRTSTKKRSASSGLDLGNGELTSELVENIAESSAIVIKGHQSGDPLTGPMSEDPVPDDSRQFQQQGAIEPPFPPHSLVAIIESSAYIAPNIAAYVTNIDAFGHRFEKTVDFSDSSATDLVRDALSLQAQNDWEDGGKSGVAPEPTEKKIEETIEVLKRRQQMEKFRLDSLFNFIHPTLSFPQIRKRTRQDYESTGNAYWEIIRSRDSKIAQVEPAVGLTMRLMDLDKKFTNVKLKYKTTPITMGTKNMKRKFRRFIQLKGVRNSTTIVWFKEFGDSRIMSEQTGKFFRDRDAMKTKEPKAVGATEILHFRIYSSRTPYGVPRWVGVLISAMGSRHSEEVNFLYFENKSVPPMALLVSGGKLAGGAVKRIKDYIQNEIKGKRNFHKILVIEAESKQGMPGTTPNNQIRLELKPLTDAQQNDALFQNYDKRNAVKIGSAFRVPPILRGDTEDFNRATAEAAKTFAEDQVFNPERDDFDFMMNRLFLLDMDVLLWRFKSLAPITRDPAIMAVIVERLIKANLLTPKEGRLVAQDILNLDLPEIKEGWANQPMSLTLAGFIKGMVPGVTAPEGGEGGLGFDDVKPGAMSAADRNGEDNIDGGPEATAKAGGDLSTTDLATGGGLKLPAQPGATAAQQRRQRQELIAMLRELQRLGIIDNVNDLIGKSVASSSGIKIDNSATDPKGIITIQVPRQEFEKWFEDDPDLEIKDITEAEATGVNGN